MRLRARLAHTEEGAALVIALVFLAVFGILVPALLGLADTNIKFFASAKSTDNRMFAADWGVEYGIKQLSSALGPCPNTASGLQTISPAPPQLNGRTVSVQCQTMESVGAGGVFGDYSVITTDTTQPASLTTQSGAASSVTIAGGNVYVAGPMNLLKGLIVTGGNVQHRHASCSPTPAQPARLTVTPDPPFSWSCTTSGAPNPTISLPPSVPAAAPAAACTTVAGLGVACGLPAATCKIFYPGTYTTPPALLAGTGTGNYFASGIYYFNGIGLWDPANRTTVFGGKPKAPEVPAPDITAAGRTPCATDVIADTQSASYANDANAYGVEWIFGGSSGMFIDQDVTVELFTRYAGATPEGTDGVSFYTVRTTGSGWTAWAPPPGGACDSDSSQACVLEVSGNNTRVAIHGGVYAYNAPIAAFATLNTVAQFAGGIVAKDLSLQASAVGGGLAVSTAATNVTRRVLIRGTAQGLSGESDILYQAVVLFTPSTGGTYTPTVLSWRRVS